MRCPRIANPGQSLAKGRRCVRESFGELGTIDWHVIVHSKAMVSHLPHWRRQSAPLFVNEMLAAKNAALSEIGIVWPPV
jgi:hypothetical protein